MKLSEAIRLGSMMRPQTFRVLRDDVGTCAMGAAFEAVGCSLDNDVQLDVDEGSRAVFPIIDRRGMRCPVPLCFHDNYTPRLASVVIHLNDWHMWTREQIAAWVEIFEPEQPDAAVVASAVSVEAAS